MTGSFWAPIIIPIVAMIALAAWLTMVYHADAHPGWKAHSAATSTGSTGATVRDNAREQMMRRDLASLARHDEDAAKLGDHDGGERAPSSPGQRAA
jgi:hypothetical protein